MHELIPDDPLASLLLRLAESGVVVDYVLLALDDPSMPVDAMHRDAAASGMAVLSGRQMADLEQRQRHWRYWRGRDDADMSYLAERPTWRLTFDITKATAVDETSDVFLRDYWHAFSDAPQGPQIVEPELSERFQEVNRLLCGEISRWSIRRWSSDWSNYFDAGLEWRGAFLWTLVSPERARVLWIGASSTD